MTEMTEQQETTDELRERLYQGARDAQYGEGDPAIDRQIADLIAAQAPAAVPAVLAWLQAAEKAGRAEAEDHAAAQQEIREWQAAMVCPQCGTDGRGAAERDIPRDVYDVRTAGEWLEAHDGLTVCDKCGHRWQVS